MNKSKQKLNQLEKEMSSSFGKESLQSRSEALAMCLNHLASSIPLLPQKIDPSKNPSQISRNKINISCDASNLEISSKSKKGEQYYLANMFDPDFDQEKEIENFIMNLANQGIEDSRDLPGHIANVLESICAIVEGDIDAYYATNNAYLQRLTAECKQILRRREDPDETPEDIKLKLRNLIHQTIYYNKGGSD